MNNPLVQVDPGLYIWTIVTFVVLLLLLAKFAWRPLLEALERRQEAIRKSLDEARQAKQELGRLHEESARILAQARAEADAIISRTRADAVRAGEELKQKARADAENIVKHAEREIQLETSRAAAEGSAGGRGHLDRHRVEDPPAQSDTGRQRTADRRDAAGNPDVTAQLAGGVMDAADRRPAAS